MKASLGYALGRLKPSQAVAAPSVAAAMGGSAGTAEGTTSTTTPTALSPAARRATSLGKLMASRLAPSATTSASSAAAQGAAVTGLEVSAAMVVQAAAKGALVRRRAREGTLGSATAGHSSEEAGVVNSFNDHGVAVASVALHAAAGVAASKGIIAPKNNSRHLDAVIV